MLLVLFHRTGLRVRRSPLCCVAGVSDLATIVYKLCMVRRLVNMVYAPGGAVLLTVGRSYVGNYVTHSMLLDRACAFLQKSS